jgi:AcrR family transcriptional regulator
MTMSDSTRSDARERILTAAYDLFSRRGVRAVGVDELIARSGVANATFYRHFASKDDLVLAFLERREQLWTVGTIVEKALKREGTAKDQLLAVFDVFDEWFRRRDYAGDPFMNVFLEMGTEHPLGRASLERLNTVRRMIQQRAEKANMRDPESFARSMQLLMKGSIVGARMGDADSALRARQLAGWLIDQFSTP